MLFKTFGAGLCGTEGFPVCCEADVENGFPQISFIGSLAQSVRESSDRVRTAIANAGIRLEPRHVTISLSPGDIKKEGCAYDLPVAAALLGAYGYIPDTSAEGTLFAGELSLGGEVLSVNGVIAMVSAAREAGLTRCFIPKGNLREGSVVEGISCYGVSSLPELLEYLTGERPLPAPAIYKEPSEKQPPAQGFSGICGQELAKRATLLAAGGRHNILYIGPAGTGKTMLASRLPSILPGMTTEERLELTRIYSISGLLDPEEPFIRRRPFRSPHHTITPQALSGGGRIPVPGEVSLADHGILFLDELPEFKAGALDILRQPLEEKKIHISRVSGAVTFPASFQLVCAMNPCRCGFWPDRERCRCNELQVRAYISRISKPLLDRIDLCVETVPVAFGDLNRKQEEESCLKLVEEVERVRQIQADRFRSSGIRFNSEMNTGQIEAFCPLPEAERTFLQSVYEKSGMSARALHKILRVARTAADFAGAPDIRHQDLCEAIAFRSLENKYWNAAPEAARIRRKYHDRQKKN
ncbi:MAG: YifB family Mg chelatase-like AAA ATPase [Stomatobaculum sp.]|nr:YifB family Mg chelatase-like AAA ATPase [Stomatobaculum sp.]